MNQRRVDTLSRRFWKGLWDHPQVRLATARLFFLGVPHGRFLGLRVLKVEARALEAELRYRDDLVGNPWTGVLHGGPLITLIDQTCGTCASLSMNPPWLVATLDLRVDYLRPADPGLPLTARAEAYRVAREIVFLRGTISDGSLDTPVATCMATFMRTRPLVQSPIKRIMKMLSRKRRASVVEDSEAA